MTHEQWEKLRAVIKGELLGPLPVGFIIDSPWLPGWAGVPTLDYFTSDEIWFQAHLKAARQFPEIIFLPGFWAEFGMCTEPSAFGAKCSWQENEPPFAHKIIRDAQDIHLMRKPNPARDGFCPFVLKRLQHYQNRIEQAGHNIKFAVARGPLNIASFLMGGTEFLTALRTHPDQIHRLLHLITEFLLDWLTLQIETFPSIDAIFLLDDIVGFVGDADFRQFALPYLGKIFQAFNVKVKFFHNDAAGLVCAPYLSQLGVNLFNFSFEHSLAEMKQLTDNKITLLGNIPPLDVLAHGTEEQVRRCVKSTWADLSDKSRIILSCGGGMPGGVSTENIAAFLSATKAAK